MPIFLDDKQAKVEFSRKIRSFVRREGRLSPGLKQNVHQYWDAYGIKVEGYVDFAKIFGNLNPCILEIGFGKGQSLLSMAQAEPDYNFIGIEVYQTGVAHLLQGIAQLGLTNLRVACLDSMEFLQNAVNNNSLHKIQLFFPDPWPKKRHGKRRLVKEPFIALIAQKLSPQGIFHMATDWQPYATEAMAFFENSHSFQNMEAPYCFAPRPHDRPLTPFELRGMRLGHSIYDLLYKRLSL